MDRIQRLGDKDNYWQMGDTGPCGPCSELHIDRGPAFGPEGGPLGDPAGDRFMEFWNLVFMQFDQAADGTRTPLPKPSIDTGAGLERILALVQGVDSVWETDLMQPLIDEACSITGKSYIVGDYDDRNSFAMRVLAEHARSSAMLVNDGVFPSNEARGYVLRRIIRRAVRYAYLLGTETLVMPRLVDVAIDVMGNAYPDVDQEPRLRRQRDRQGGGAVPPHAEERPVDPRRRAGRRHPERRTVRRCRARPRSCCTTRTGSRSNSPRRSPASAASRSIRPASTPR